MSHPFVRRAHWVSPVMSTLDPGALYEVFFSGRRPEPSTEINAFWHFRKTFDLPSAPQQATAHVSADGRYHLYVNGVFVGRGPSRCDPAFQSFDTRDITAHLHAGRNVVAILLHSYGRDMSWYQLPSPLQLTACGCANVFFQADIELPDGSKKAIDSDDSWRYAKADAWKQDTRAGSVGFMEVFDAGKAVDGWMLPDFDDGGWERARDLNPFGPFPYMTPRAIPYLAEGERLPSAIVGFAELEPARDAADPFEQAEQESIQEAAADRIQDGEGLLQGRPATVAANESLDACILFDFEDTVTGYPRLDVTAPAGVVIDIAYSERLSDGKVEMPERGPITSSNVHRYITRDGRQTWEKFEWVGLRYLQITVRNPQGPVVIHKIALNETGYPVEDMGSFECSDPLLNRIWQAGAKTVRRCMHDGYEDCPHREQRQWMGDIYVEALTNYAAFGDTQLVAQALRQLSQSQRPDGMTAMAAPGDLAARASIMSIPDWGLYWVLTLGKYVDYTGDLSLAEEIIAPVLKLLDWFNRFTDEHGLLNNLPEWTLIDWAHLDRRGESTAYNALFYRTLRITEDLANRLRMPLIAERCAQRADRIRDALNVRLWDEARGVYVDACADGERGRRVSQQANSVCIAYGIAPKERWDRIFGAILDETRLVITRTGMRSADIPEPDFDEERNIVTAQPFFMHHVHRALIAAGRHGDMLDNIRRRWGAMIAAGATTIWEVWHPLVSQCHGWSTTPTFDLSTEVLGVASLEPGFDRVRIAPQPADLEWAKGVFPTVKGDIPVNWEKKDGGFLMRVTVPAGCTAEVTLPSHPGGWREVNVGDAGDVQADEAARSRAKIVDVILVEGSVTLVVAGPREIRVEAKHG